MVVTHIFGRIYAVFEAYSKKNAILALNTPYFQADKISNFRLLFFDKRSLIVYRLAVRKIE